MLPSMLIATGLIENVSFNEEFPDIDFTIVESIISALKELKENPDKYNYILISASSFVLSDGLNHDDTMKALAEILLQTNYDRFVLLDIKSELEVCYNKYLREVKYKAKVNTDNQVRLRTFSKIIEQILKNVESQKQEAKDNEPQDKKEKKSLFKLPKKEKKEPIVEKEPVHQEVKKKPLPEPKQIDNFDEIKEKKKKKFDYEVFQRSPILFTSPSPKVGTTTVALATARLLASQGLTTVYVQVTEKLFTCNNFIKEKDVMRTSAVDVFTTFEKDLEKCISVYKNVHLVTNSLYDKVKLDEGTVLNLLAKCCRSFDIVILDIDFDVLKNMPSVLSMFRYYVTVVQNSLDCCVDVADKYGEILTGLSKALGIALTQNSNIVISRIADRFDVEGNKLTQDIVIPQIVDIDNDLSDMEFLNVAGYIQEDYSGMFDPFSDSALSKVVSIVERLK